MKKLVVLTGDGAKFRKVRQNFLSPTKQKFAVTCVRIGVRAADGVRLGLYQDKWK
ncbi:MAG: hypothetical protein IPG56_13650 [Caulobacteraceae bacterium]|nr:hypothetical protein [Caulobacteraceae bacterium]